MDSESVDSESTVRKTISMPGALFSAATRRKKLKGYAAFSDYIQALIRADQELGILGPQQPRWRKAS